MIGPARSAWRDATWGAGDPWRREHGGVHVGEVKGAARPVGGVLAFTQGETRTFPFGAGDPHDCGVTMIRRGPYLLVRDNGDCGGQNVPLLHSAAPRAEAGPRGIARAIP